ncbi:unnamed protein product [Rotaria sp. Silwood2]|nr:unnamed protein product [Rotaria sp. Silwood2]CAF3441222.1 unnamed protein product [Rotaria sp. Silwood2]CAF4551318.1 unnamed protein product [Rotaria sp. Silwood2]CAF4582181.1 unnamed protein product [Rotaria sp. Silwood2]
MLNNIISKNRIVIPNGMSEDVDTSESEDEMNKIQNILKKQLTINDNSSSSETSDLEEKPQDTFKSKSKKKKRIHWIKKPFMPPTSTFIEILPPPPINNDLKPVDYFYSMFGKE